LWGGSLGRIDLEDWIIGRYLLFVRFIPLRVAESIGVLLFYIFVYFITTVIVLLIIGSFIGFIIDLVRKKS